MKKKNRFRIKIKHPILWILLAAGVIFFDVYAIQHAAQSTLLIVFCTVMAFALLAWSSSGFKFAEFPVLILLGIAASGVIVALFGVYAMLSPAYRAKVVEDRLRREQRSAERAADIKSIEAMISTIALPEEFADDFTSGSMLVAIRDDKGINLADLSAWYDETIPANMTDHLAEAQSLVWIEESAQVVGTYRYKVAGPITLYKTGNALKIIWKVWVIDLEEQKVTAQDVFVGPDPPELIEATGDFGVPPIDDAAQWLLSLPVR